MDALLKWPTPLTPLDFAAADLSPLTSQAIGPRLGHQEHRDAGDARAQRGARIGNRQYAPHARLNTPLHQRRCSCSVALPAPPPTHPPITPRRPPAQPLLPTAPPLTPPCARSSRRPTARRSSTFASGRTVTESSSSTCSGSSTAETNVEVKLEVEVEVEIWRRGERLSRDRAPATRRRWQPLVRA